eukprot:4730511-Pyramimonas_sp.AAC.1
MHALNGGDALDALTRALDATQRDDEASGRSRQQCIDRTSLSGTEAQVVAEGLLRETRAQLEPGSLISRATWLCLAPHYTPLLRPVLQVRNIDNRPFEVLTRWLQIADIHTPDDIRGILSEGGETSP